MPIRSCQMATSSTVIRCPSTRGLPPQMPGVLTMRTRSAGGTRPASPAQVGVCGAVGSILPSYPRMLSETTGRVREPARGKKEARAPFPDLIMWVMATAVKPTPAHGAPEDVLDVHDTACCVVGGGPGGVMLALLLARRGVPVTLLEAHPTFDRDFRGDTIHPG